MLRVFRDNLKYLSWVLWLVIIVLILFVFVDFGSGIPGTAGGATDAAATVGDEKITYAQFQRAYQSQEDYLRRAYGEGFTRETARQMGLPLRVMNELIDDRLLKAEARRIGLTVTDDEVRKEILEQPVFKDDQGRFVGSESYGLILRRAGYTPDSFEAAIRGDLLTRKLRTVLEQGVYVSDDEIERAYRDEVERADIRYLQLPAARFADQIDLAPGDLETYLAEHQEEFRVPERRGVSYLWVDPAALEPTVAITDDEISAYYGENRDDYSREEQVRARHILLRVEDDQSAPQVEQRLREIRGRIEAGEDFAALAQELSDDPGSKQSGGDLGFFGRGQMIGAFEEAAFGAEPGQLVGPLRTTFGYHLIEVLEKQAGGTRSLGEVREEIRGMLKAERAATLAEGKARELAQRARGEGVADSEAFAALGSGEPGVSLLTVPAFTRDDFVPEIGRATAFSVTAFGLEPGEISAPVRVEGGWAVLRLDQIEPPRLPQLEEVRQEVEAAVRLDRQRRAAESRLEEARQAILEGGSLDEVAEDLELEVRESGLFGRDSAIGGLGRQPQLAQAALELEEGDVAGPIVIGAEVILFQVSERQRFDPQQFAAARQSTLDRLENERLGQLLGSLIASRRNELGVTFDPTFLENFQLPVGSS